jgi:hypothetical protein
MEEFDYKKFLVENRLTPNSRLLSENESDIKKVEEKLKAASEVLSTFAQYAKARSLKYLTNSPTQADAQEQFGKIMSQKMKDVLSNLHKFDIQGIEPIEIFMKQYYPKYEKFYDYPTITQDNIDEANKALSYVTDVVNFIDTKKRPSYNGEYKDTGLHNEMQKTTDDVLRALDAFEKI